MEPMKKFVCMYPCSHFEINNPNGDVTMCCNNNTVLGNVNDGSIGEIWNEKGFQAARARMLDEGRCGQVANLSARHNDSGLRW